MSHPLAFELIAADRLRVKAGAFHAQGYRLVQISATRLPEQVELTYSFDLAGQMANLRLLVPGTHARVPSISSIYWCAFIYENEMHDLFDLQIDGMAVDFQGAFYKTTVKFPFGSVSTPTVKPAPPPPATKGAPSVS